MSAHPLLTKVLYASLRGTGVAIGAEASDSELAESIVDGIPPITADRLEDFLAKRHCPCCDWYGALDISFPADAPDPVQVSQDHPDADTRVSPFPHPCIPTSSWCHHPCISGTQG